MYDSENGQQIYQQLVGHITDPVIQMYRITSLANIDLDLQQSALDCETTLDCLGTPFCSTSPNTVGSGAVMCVTGSTNLADEFLTLGANGLPPGVTGLFYFGPGQENGGMGIPFGEGIQKVLSTHPGDRMLSYLPLAHVFELGPAGHCRAVGAGRLPRLRQPLLHRVPRGQRFLVEHRQWHVGPAGRHHGCPQRLDLHLLHRSGCRREP